jgi:hypothetical protein
MRKKTFDCVEMKRQGQERLYELLKDMSVEEQIEFWKQRTAEMLEWQAELRARRQEAGEDTPSPVGAGEARG